MSAPAQRAVVVTGGNGGGTVVYLPTSDRGHVAAMESGGGQVCSECMDASKAYFLTGHLEPHCMACGGMRTAIGQQFSTAGHN